VPIPSLLIRDQLSTLRHRDATLKHSRAATPKATGNQPALGNPPPVPLLPAEAAAIQAVDLTAPPAADSVTNPFKGQQAAGTPPLPPRRPHMDTALPAPIVQPFLPPPLRQSTPAPGSGDTPFNHSVRTLFHQTPQPSLIVQQPMHSNGHSTSLALGVCLQVSPTFNLEGYSTLVEAYFREECFGYTPFQPVESYQRLTPRLRGTR
jgi:hypothetical protein